MMSEESEITFVKVVEEVWRWAKIVGNTAENILSTEKRNDKDK